VAASFFVSDMHGSTERYDKLFTAIARERPAGVFLGGDLLPNLLTAPLGGAGRFASFLDEELIPRLDALRRTLGGEYPQIFAIFGNDDPRAGEESAQGAERRGLWRYAHGRKLAWRGLDVYGYACIPPSPFRLKDWERYDVSRFVDPDSIPPEEGIRTAPVPPGEAARATIAEDLAALFGDNDDLDRAIFLCHVPPYRSLLDRAGLDGRYFDHAPLDVHIGSIAVRRLIEERAPLVTLHGHVHESARITGSWRERIGRTMCLSAAHDGPELALVRFDPADPASATRELI
jgi:Icc-related predicted phosphoesterase